MLKYRTFHKLINVPLIYKLKLKQTTTMETNQNNLFESTITIPKGMIQNIGAAPSVVLCYIIEAGYKNGEASTIYFTNMEEAARLCGLSSRGAITKVLDKLEELGLITTALKGLPSRKHITVNIEEIVKISSTK